MLKPVLRALHKPIYESREAELVRLILPHLGEDARVLDVGCGFGHLGRALMEASRVPIHVEGAETARREGELIPVTASPAGAPLPWPAKTFDAVIVADVLHHDPHPERLLRECARVSANLVIVKDHLREGLFAQQRISLIDWAANAGYNVPVLYQYNSLGEWRTLIGKLSSGMAEERTSVDLYPPVFNQLFGKGLHYFAAFRRASGLP